jgi:2-phospho-L-lactate guanylyltransferase
MRVVVPLSVSGPKSRLADVLSPAERRAFALVMCRDVLAAARDAGLDPELLATAPVDLDAPTTVDDRPLSEAVNAVLADATDATDAADGTGTDGDDEDADGNGNGNENGDGDGDGDGGTGAHEPVCVLMADLALATPDAVARLVDAPGEVVVAPGRGGGTNALVVRHPDFRVDYHGVSYRDHREAAAALDASVTVVDSMRLATDVDEPADLVEVLLHGPGDAPDWLRERGVALSVGDGRVSVTRESPPGG